MVQIKFKDTDNDLIHGGIVLDNRDVICACCGCLIPKDEQTKEMGFELLETYKDWIDFSEAIID